MMEGSLHSGSKKPKLLEKSINSSISLKVNMTKFWEHDSGWSLLQILHLRINVNKFNTLYTGYGIKLPAHLAKKRVCINILVDDCFCFAKAVVLGFYNAEKISNWATSYPDFKKY
ncbi:hypothetical protein PR048_020852 [Dryococelus australis]|uniref:Uncharacterized protein n=1 Tax=Dryococelus australis TaxID=614101 RepID=A0ABQ9GWL2_9NEOP|nr:hypothetical protein PR048_020852 [Dryococelus australis]